MVCGNCKPIYVQRLREGGGAVPGGLNYAGFWIRFGARVLDGILAQVVFIPLRLVLGLGAFGNASPDNALALGIMAIMLTLVQVVALAIYEILMTGMRGATLGKMALGLKVVRADGSPISMGLSTGRYFATYVSGITLFIGYMMAGWDNQKRSLHDRICETRVIRTK